MLVRDKGCYVIEQAASTGLCTCFVAINRSSLQGFLMQLRRSVLFVDTPKHSFSAGGAA